MEKLFLVLILNSPDHSAQMVRYDLKPNESCLFMAETINSSPTNRVVYSDELDSVLANFAFCETAKGVRAMVAIPTPKPKRR